MRQASIESLLVKISPRFALVNAVAARAGQLIRGDIPAIETNTRNPVLIAMEELTLGRLHVVPRKPIDEPRKVADAVFEEPQSESPPVEPEPLPDTVVAAR